LLPVLTVKTHQTA